MKIQTKNLIGPALDYAVAIAEGATDEWRADGPFLWRGVPCIREDGHDIEYRPSTRWADGGPIIERKRISFATSGTGPPDEHGNSPIVAISEKGLKAMEGPTHLIAAMRAHVADELGEEVEIPDELL